MATRMHDPRDEQQPPLSDRFTTPENEQAVIGALLGDNRTFEVVIEHCSADDFAHPLNRTLFQVIQAEIGKGHTVTPVSLFPLLRTGREETDKDVRSYIVDASSSMVSAAFAKDFARAVGEAGRMRRLFEAVDAVRGRMLSDVAADGIIAGGMGSQAAQFASELEAAAFGASAAKSERMRLISIADSIDSVIERIHHIQSTGKPVGATSYDISEFTDVVGPLERTHMVVIAGRPGMGKSGLACSLSRSFASHGFGVGFVSLEMGEIDLGQRFASELAFLYDREIKHADIRDGKLREAELQELAWCAEQARKLPVKLADVAGITLSRLGVILRRMKREFEAAGQSFDVVFVDYLQLILPDIATGNRVSDMTGISNGLKRLAKELDVCVVALSQLSRAVEGREDKRPMMQDLRETGAIEQDADTICFVYREEYYLLQQHHDREKKPQAYEAWRIALQESRDNMDLIVPKRRGGATGTKTVRFYRDVQAVRGGDHIRGPLFS